MTDDAAPYSPAPGVYVYPGCDIDATARLSPGVCVGLPPDPDDDCPEYRETKTRIGAGCYLGPYVLIYRGACLADSVLVDPYCRIGHKTVIGAATRVLYGARIHNDVVVGSYCVVGGNCSDGVRLGDHVTHMGRIAHKYNRPLSNWAETAEPSPVIEDRVVIGANALIIGPVTIGHNSYVAAGEIVRHSVPAKSVYYGGRIYPSHMWEGSLSQGGFFDA